MKSWEPKMFSQLKEISLSTLKKYSEIKKKTVLLFQQKIFWKIFLGIFENYSEITKFFFLSLKNWFWFWFRLNCDSGSVAVLESRLNFFSFTFSLPLVKHVILNLSLEYAILLHLSHSHCCLGSVTRQFYGNERLNQVSTNFSQHFHFLSDPQLGRYGWTWVGWVHCLYLLA